MSCLINEAIPLNCIDGIAGIKAVYVGVDIVIASATYSVDNEITGLTGTGAFYEYQLPKDTGSISEAMTISNVNGTAFYDQQLTINLQKLDAFKRNQLLLLSRNRDIKSLVLDNNNNLWLLGKDRGGVIASGTSATGVNPGDQQGYTITIGAQEPEMMYQVTSLAAIHGITITTA